MLKGLYRAWTKLFARELATPVVGLLKMAEQNDLKDGLTAREIAAHAAEQGIVEEEAVRQGMEEKSREFIERGKGL